MSQFLSDKHLKYKLHLLISSLHCWPKQNLALGKNGLWYPFPLCAPVPHAHYSVLKGTPLEMSLLKFVLICNTAPQKEDDKGPVLKAWNVLFPSQKTHVSASHIKSNVGGYVRAKIKKINKFEVPPKSGTMLFFPSVSTLIPDMPTYNRYQESTQVLIELQCPQSLNCLPAQFKI